MARRTGSGETELALVRDRRRGSIAGGAALLFAGGTLLCCALPILLVSMGLGAAVAALTSNVPWLVTLSHHKGSMFAGSALVLLASGLLIVRSGRACPLEPALARACARADRWNRRVLWIAGGVWAIGFFAAYLWLPLRQTLAG